MCWWGHQVRKDHWKGMSPEQLAAIKQQQAAQLEAKRAAEEAAAAAAAQAVAESRSVQRAVLLQAQAAQLARRQEAAAVAATLREQMAAKAAKDTATNQVGWDIAVMIRLQKLLGGLRCWREHQMHPAT